MRIIMIDDNGRQSDITQEVQNIMRGNIEPVASDREQHFAPRQQMRPMQFTHQQPMQPQGRFQPHPQNWDEGQMPQQGFIPVPVDEFGNPLEEIPEGEQFGGFIGGPAENPAEFGGYAQRPVFQRPTMTRPTMQGRPQGQFMHQQPQTPRGGFMQRPENMEEQAHRFAQRMMGGRQGMPTQQPRRAMVSPNYRRNF